MTREIFRYKNHHIEYVELCNDGPETWFAFHGFSRIPEDFDIFAKKKSAGRRLISFSLFQHNGSKVPQEFIEQNQISPELWKEIFLALLNYFNVKKVSLLGYSMGGKSLFKHLI